MLLIIEKLHMVSVWFVTVKIRNLVFYNQMFMHNNGKKNFKLGQGKFEIIKRKPKSLAMNA